MRSIVELLTHQAAGGREVLEYSEEDGKITVRGKDLDLTLDAEDVEIVERALDASATQFERTGTIWEFYHPHGGDPLDVQRKPHTQYNTPCPDYLGHNPLIAMARIYDTTHTPVR